MATTRQLATSRKRLQDAGLRDALLALKDSHRAQDLSDDEYMRQVAEFADHEHLTAHAQVDEEWAPMFDRFREVQLDTSTVEATDQTVSDLVVQIDRAHEEQWRAENIRR